MWRVRLNCPTTLRPHYHVIFFGLSRADLIDALNDWSSKYGFFHAKNVVFNSDSLVKVSRYVSKYCSKGIFSNPKEQITQIEKAFRLSSKGIGKCYVESMKFFHLEPLKTKDYQEVLKRRLVVLPDNKAYPMPKYYKDKIYGTKNLLSYKMFCASQARADDIFIQKFNLLRTQNPTWSISQTFNYLHMQDVENKKSKYLDLRKKLANFYQRSKI